MVYGAVLTAQMVLGLQDLQLHCYLWLTVSFVCVLSRQINNGVYRAGFAHKQEAYDTAVREVFDGLDKVPNLRLMAVSWEGGEVQRGKMGEIALATINDHPYSEMSHDLFAFSWYLLPPRSCDSQRLVSQVVNLTQQKPTISLTGSFISVWRDPWKQTLLDWFAVYRSRYQALHHAHTLWSGLCRAFQGEYFSKIRGVFACLFLGTDFFFCNFQCNKKRIIDYPNLWAYTRDILHIPGVKDTVSQEHIQKHYQVISANRKVKLNIP